MTWLRLTTSPRTARKFILAALVALTLGNSPLWAQSFAGYGDAGQIVIGQGDGVLPRWRTSVGPLTIQPSGIISVDLTASPYLTGMLSMGNGGCNASLRPQAGGLLYSSAVGCKLLPRTPFVNQMLMSGPGPTYAPHWSQSIFADGFAANSLLWSNGPNNVQGLSPAPSALLVTDASGKPSLQAPQSSLSFASGKLGCTSASASQLGCVTPDNVTIQVVGGLLTAIGGAASSIGIGSTTVTGSGKWLYNDGVHLAAVSGSGTANNVATAGGAFSTGNFAIGNGSGDLIDSGISATVKPDFYVSTTGVDAGDCTNVGSPCRHIAYAALQALKSNSGNGNQTVHLAAGTYTEDVVISGMGYNAGTNGQSQQLVFSGAGSGSTIWDTNSTAQCGVLTANYGANLSVTNMTLRDTGSTSCKSLLFANLGGFINVLANVNFGAVHQSHMFCEEPGSLIEVWNNISITGPISPNPRSHAQANTGCLIEYASSTVTFNGTTITWGTGFFEANDFAIVYLNSFGQVNSTSGPRYALNTGLLNTNGVGCGSTPGSSAGTTSNSGICK